MYSGMDEHSLVSSSYMQLPCCLGVMHNRKRFDFELVERFCSFQSKHVRKKAQKAAECIKGVSINTTFENDGMVLERWLGS